MKTLKSETPDVSMKTAPVPNMRIAVNKQDEKQQNAGFFGQNTQHFLNGSASQRLRHSIGSKAGTHGNEHRGVSGLSGQKRVFATY